MSDWECVEYELVLIKSDLGRKDGERKDGRREEGRTERGRKEKERTHQRVGQHGEGRGVVDEGTSRRFRRVAGSGPRGTERVGGRFERRVSGTHWDRWTTFAGGGNEGSRGRGQEDPGGTPGSSQRNHGRGRGDPGGTPGSSCRNRPNRKT